MATTSYCSPLLQSYIIAEIFYRPRQLNEEPMDVENVKK